MLSLGDGTGGGRDDGIDGVTHLGGGGEPSMPRLGFESSIGTAAVPAWHELINGPADRKLALLADPAWRARARHDWDHPLDEQNSFRAEQLHELILSDPDDGPGPKGISLAQLAAANGQHPSDALADWVLANGVASRYTKLNAGRMSREDREAQDRRYFGRADMIFGGTDAGAHLKMFCGAGSNLYLLTHWVREMHELTIEQAVHFLTKRSTDFIAHPRIYLGPESAKKDAPMIEKPWNWNAGACKQWAEQQTAKIVLSPDEAARVKAMHDAVFANPMAAALLSKGSAQTSLRYDFGKFKVQARPDWRNTEGITLPGGIQLPHYLCDLKSAEDDAQFQKSRRNYGYDRQNSLYTDIDRMIIAEQRGIKFDDTPHMPFFFIVVYKTAPIQCVVQVLERQDLADAHDQVFDDIRRLKECYRTGEWPGVQQGIVTMEPLDYQRAKAKRDGTFQPEAALTITEAA